MLGLCSNDPIVSTLQSVFHANIVEIPEERIRPLYVVANLGNKTTSFRGAISALLKSPTTYKDPPVQQSLMANISGSKTRQVDLKFGLQILGNFLNAFGVPSINVNAAFTGATKVSFSFNKVIRYWVDDGVLGGDLIGSVVDSNNPAAAIYFGPQKYNCYILDSSITSSDFTISVDQSSRGNFQIDVPAIQQIVQKANVQLAVSSSSTTSISFTGQKQLGFAFSCVSASLDASGRIVSLAPAGSLPALEFALPTGERAVARSPHILFAATPTMLDTEFFTQERAARSSKG